jgi:hypothetical protein
VKIFQILHVLISSFKKNEPPTRKSAARDPFVPVEDSQRTIRTWPTLPGNRAFRKFDGTHGLGVPVLKKRRFIICLPSVLSKVLKRSIALFNRDVNGNTARFPCLGFGSCFSSV